MTEIESEPSRLERVLAYSALTLIALSVISFFATLIAALVGADRAVLATSFWPVVVWVGYVGLPVGFLLILILIMVSRHRRKKSINA